MFMKALCYDNQSKKAVYRTDYPMPTPKAHESLIQVVLCGVCNTDKEILRGYKPDFSGVLGHEFVGIVRESNDPALIGKHVVGELNEGCGTCLYCKTGREKHCDNRQVIGIAQKDGAFAEYIAMATRLLHVLPEDLAPQHAVYCEPFAAALQILEQGQITPDKNVAIIGDGRLAFMIAQAVALLGADLTVFGRHAEKLAMFAPYAKTATEPCGSFEVVIDACGVPSGLATAARLVRRGGTIVLKSTYAGDANVNMSSFVVNEITLVGSRCGPFAPALRLLQRGLVRLPEITLYPLSEYEKAFMDKDSFKTGFSFI